MHSPNLKWYIVILLLTLILGFLIYLSLKSNSSMQRSTISDQNSNSEAFSIFDSVNASLNGEITKVEGNKIFFENDRGVKGEAVASEGISITDMNKVGTLPSSDLQSIELNKPAGINFDIKDGTYTITSIIFPQP